MYNYKNYMLLINKGLGYNRFYIKLQIQVKIYM